MRHHPLKLEDLTLSRESGQRTVSAGQFYWGGILPKSNGGAQRLAQIGQKSIVECNGISQPDCESDGSSRYESRS